MTGKFFAVAAAAAFACSATIVPAGAADFVMKFGTATINETQHQFIKFYKEELEKASGGRIEVQVYPASQLGPIPREIEGVQLGNIQMCIRDSTSGAPMPWIAVLPWLGSL